MNSQQYSEDGQHGLHRRLSDVGELVQAETSRDNLLHDIESLMNALVDNKPDAYQQMKTMAGYHLASIIQHQSMSN